METIAITDWNDIVSPLYDASCRLLIIRPEGGRTTVNVRDLLICDRAELCATEGVGVVICGAISTLAVTLLHDK